MVTLQVVSVVSLESFEYIFKGSRAGSYVHWLFSHFVIFQKSLRKEGGWAHNWRVQSIMVATSW